MVHRRAAVPSLLQCSAITWYFQRKSLSLFNQRPFRRFLLNIHETIPQRPARWICIERFYYASTCPREAAGRSRLSRGRVSNPRPLTKERRTRQGCRAEEDVIEGPVVDRFGPLECRSALEIIRFTVRATRAGQRLKSSRHELLLLNHSPGFLSPYERHLSRQANFPEHHCSRGT